MAESDSISPRIFLDTQYRLGLNFWLSQFSNCKVKWLFTRKIGSGLNEQGKNEFRVYQSRKAALRNTVKNEDTKREEIVHQKSQKHLENLIRCSESGRPFRIGSVKFLLFRRIH